MKMRVSTLMLALGVAAPGLVLAGCHNGHRAVQSTTTSGPNGTTKKKETVTQHNNGTTTVKKTKSKMPAQ